MKSQFTLWVDGFDYGKFDDLFAAIKAAPGNAHFRIFDNSTMKNAVIDWDAYHEWKDRRAAVLASRLLTTKRSEL